MRLAMNPAGSSLKIVGEKNPTILFSFRVRNITYYERKWLYADYNDSSDSSNDIIGNYISIGRRTLSIIDAGDDSTDSNSIIRR